MLRKPDLTASAHDKVAATGFLHRLAALGAVLGEGLQPVRGLAVPAGLDEPSLPHVACAGGVRLLQAMEDMLWYLPLAIDCPHQTAQALNFFVP